MPSCYYDHSEPMFKSAFSVAKTKTIFGMVGSRWDFWFLLFIHGVLAILAKRGVIRSVEADRFDWTSINAIQFLLILLLTFYNGHGFNRYRQLYALSMRIIKGTMLFVHELVTGLPYPELENYRITATKYLIALVFLHFMRMTSGTLDKTTWRELVRKGLLTRIESERLAEVPSYAHEHSLILVAWAMVCVDGALGQPCMSVDPRQLRSAFTHNRTNGQCNNVLLACFAMTSILADPIPFPYYNLMNALLLFNCFFLSVASAFIGSYWTVFPLAVALLFFMGLREVASALAEPFGVDDVDFPVASFLEYTFDNAVCLLEAFQLPESVDAKSMLDRSNRGFTDMQLRRQVRSELIYQKHLDPVTSNPFAWNKDMPMQTMAACDEGPSSYMGEFVVSKAGSSKVRRGVGGRGGEHEAEIEEESDGEGEVSEDESLDGLGWLRNFLWFYLKKTLGLGKKKDAQEQQGEPESEAALRRLRKAERKTNEHARRLDEARLRNVALEEEVKELKGRIHLRRQLCEQKTSAQLALEAGHVIAAEASHAPFIGSREKISAALHGGDGGVVVNGDKIIIGHRLAKHEGVFVADLLSRRDAKCDVLVIGNAAALDTFWQQLGDGMRQRRGRDLDIYLKRSGVTEAAIRTLLRNAQGCLRRLDLSGNNLGAAGCYALREGISAAGCRRVIYEDNGITYRECRILAKAVTPRLNELSLGEIGPLGYPTTDVAGEVMHTERASKVSHRPESRLSSETQYYENEEGEKKSRRVQVMKRGFVLEHYERERNYWTVEKIQRYHLHPEYEELLHACDRCNCLLEPREEPRKGAAYDSGERKREDKWGSWVKTSEDEWTYN